MPDKCHKAKTCSFIRLAYTDVAYKNLHTRIDENQHNHVGYLLHAGQRPPPAFPHLPDELWHHFAGQLSTKDWVGASGTCRQLQQVQLEHLNITATSADGSISALLWLAKQLPGARSLVLQGWPVKSALQQEAADNIRSTMQPAADNIRSTMQPALTLPDSMSKLTVLSVGLGPSEDEKPSS
ncbi:hypothetical protein COCOBI_08-0160 [Coccomyxa sp. Obi]|nr:hypothetical protein COCOBI_08-0160 [Coccomyxa sp. Obi]